MKNILFLFVLSVLFSACVDLKKEQLAKNVSRLGVKLAQIEASLKDERMDSISSIKINTIQTELRIKRNLHLDTIDINLAKQLDAYKVMRKSIKPLMQQYLQLRSVVKEEKQVLKRLANDIQEGRGERHRYAEYVRFERQKVNQISALAKDYLRSKAVFFQDYQRLYPPVEAFSYSLLQKNQNR
jgi:outer membrane murein-binding lipoprotein Lpp